MDLQFRLSFRQYASQLTEDQFRWTNPHCGDGWNCDYPDGKNWSTLRIDAGMWCLSGSEKSKCAQTPVAPPLSGVDP